VVCGTGREAGGEQGAVRQRAASPALITWLPALSFKLLLIGHHPHHMYVGEGRCKCLLSPLGGPHSADCIMLVLYMRVCCSNGAKSSWRPGGQSVRP
jgi:hypothetical protein